MVKEFEVGKYYKYIDGIDDAVWSNNFPYICKSVIKYPDNTFIVVFEGDGENWKYYGDGGEWELAKFQKGDNVRFLVEYSKYYLVSGIVDSYYGTSRNLWQVSLHDLPEKFLVDEKKLNKIEKFFHTPDSICCGSENLENNYEIIEENIF